MTKYILHGGATGKQSEDNTNFFLEMTKGVAGSLTILCVYFSRPKEEWLSLFAQDKERFSSVCPTKNLHCILADDHSNFFKEQLQKSDVVYMRGGKTDMLMETLRQVKNFGALLSDKVVGGSSAGACVLSTYFYTGTPGSKIREGFGILPIKIFVHYNEDKQDELEALKSHGVHLPVYKIPEEKFFILEQ